MKAKRRNRNSCRRFIEIYTVVNNDRIFSAHLGDHALEPHLSGHNLRRRFVDVNPNFFRARERNEPRLRMRNERIADSAARSAHEVEHSGGQPDGFHDLIILPARQWRVARRLEHHRVARNNRCAGHACENCEREIPRWHNNANAKRNVHKLSLLAFVRHNGMLDAVTQHLTCIELEKVNRLCGVGIGFRPCLADFENHRCIQFEAALPHQLRSFEQIVRSLVVRNSFPLLKLRDRNLHRLVCQIRIALLKDTNNFRRLRRIVRIEFRLRVNLLAANDDRIFLVELRADFCYCFFLCFAVRGFGEINEWFVFEFWDGHSRSF